MKPALPIRALIIGDEILSGRRQDKHLAELIRLLKERHLHLSSAFYVADDPRQIQEAIEQAASQAGILFSFGGIGATPDDHTRLCAARALKTELTLHPQAEQLIRQRMQEMAEQKGEIYQPDDPIEQHRFNMGKFPQGSDIIPNAYNKIPGFSYATASGAYLYFVPGFPVMAWPMVAWVLDHLHPQLSQEADWLERSIIVFDAMEAHLTPLMQEIEQRYSEVKVFSLPGVDHPQYGRHIDLGVKGPQAQVEKAYAYLLEQLKNKQARLGPENQRT